MKCESGVCDTAYSEGSRSETRNSRCLIFSHHSQQGSVVCDQILELEEARTCGATRPMNQNLGLLTTAMTDLNTMLVRRVLVGRANCSAVRRPKMTHWPGWCVSTGVGAMLSSGGSSHSPCTVVARGDVWQPVGGLPRSTG